MADNYQWKETAMTTMYQQLEQHDYTVIISSVPRLKTTQESWAFFNKCLYSNPERDDEEMKEGDDAAPLPLKEYIK